MKWKVGLKWRMAISREWTVRPYFKSPTRACGPFEVVAHHDDVGIVAHHLDGVFQRLALG